MKIRVMHLITGLDVGGAENMLFKIAANMDRDNFENIVVCIKTGGSMLDKLEKANVEVISLGFNKKYPSLLVILKLISIIKEKKPDVLHTWLYHADLLGLIAGKISRLPHVVWNIRCSYVDMSEYSIMSSFVRFILVKLSSIPSLITVNSKCGLQAHKDIGYRAKKWKIIPNGIDTELYKPDLNIKNNIKNQLNIAGDSIVIGFVARFDPMKDHGTFFEVARRLVDKSPGINFVLAGTNIDSGNEYLNNKIKQYGLGQNIVLMGEQHELWKLLPAFDLLILTSAYGEGFPNIIGEAMSCGVPCVSTDVGDVRSIIGDAGSVAQPRDADGMLAALETMINLSGKERNEMGLKARGRIVDNYLLSNIVKEYEKTYIEIMN